MSLAAEDRLLLALARPSLRERDVSSASNAALAGLDWEYVHDASVRHGVAPMLSRSLKQWEAEDPDTVAAVPDSLRARLDGLYAGNERRCRRLFGIIGEIVTAFHAVGIAVLGLKDVQLAAEVYPDPTLRPMGDVDLLVHRDDFARAAACLQRLGFAPQPGPARRFTAKYAAGQQFRRAADETWVDLQWHVAEREWDRFGESQTAFDTALLWERAVPLRIGEHELLAPNPVDMLVHLCLHLEGHKYCELVLFSDIVAFLEHHGPDLDWAEVVETATRARATTSVYFVLLLTHLLFDQPVPPDALAHLSPPYFRGALDGPLYQNLTTLHLALDDVLEHAAPPTDVMERMEEIVRRQAARAMRLGAELDALATGAVAEGARVVVFNGALPPRAFPDASVPAFAELRAFVLDGDFEHLAKTAERHGFTREHADQVRKRSRIETVDPVLAKDPGTLTIALRREPGRIAAPSALTSNADAAITSLRARVRRTPDDTDACATVVVHELGAEEMVVHLAEWLGRKHDGHLFALCSLLELCQVDPPMDGARIAKLATDRSVETDVAAGIDIVRGMVKGNRGSTATALEEALGVLPQVATPRVLTWARHGPEVFGRRPELRAAYLWALCFLSVEGARRRVAYAWRSVFGGKGHQPRLTRIAVALVPPLLKRRRDDTVDVPVYWLDPEPGANDGTRL
jgi:hypothetical protein